MARKQAGSSQKVAPGGRSIDNRRRSGHVQAMTMFGLHKRFPRFAGNLLNRGWPRAGRAVVPVHASGIFLI